MLNSVAPTRSLLASDLLSFCIDARQFGAMQRETARQLPWPSWSCCGFFRDRDSICRLGLLPTLVWCCPGLQLPGRRVAIPTASEK